MMVELVLTPRLTAAEALARREAALYGSEKARVPHLVHGIIWAGGTVGDEVASSIRLERLTQSMKDAEPSMGLDRILIEAAALARRDQAKHVGVEHVLSFLALECAEWLRWVGCPAR